MWSFLLNSYIFIINVESQLLVVSEKKANVESFQEVEMTN